MITKQDIETLNILRNLKNRVSNNNGLPIRTRYEDGTLALVKSIKQQYRVYNKENPPLTLLHNILSEGIRLYRTKCKTNIQLAV